MCLSCLFFTFNVLLFACGGAIVAAGVASTTWEAFSFTELFQGGKLTIALSLIIFGSSIVLISLAGCCGVMRSDSCVLEVYAWGVAILLILQIAGVIAAYALRNEIKSTLEDAMLSSLKEYNGVNYDAVTLAWNYMQRNLKCCGVRGPTDWKNKTPKSCYPEQNKEVPYSSGCFWVLEQHLGDNIGIVSGVILGFFAAQASIVILAFCMARPKNAKC